MSGTETTTAARAAAEWWAKQVGAPVQRLVEPSQRDFASDFAELHFLGESAKHPVPEGAAPVFVAELEQRIEKMLGRTDWVSLGVDYGPDLELYEAAKAAGISGSRFPVKTHMNITPQYVTASLGYRGATRLVWQHPDWKRPACQSLDYNESSGKFGTKWCTLPRFHDGDHGDWKPDPRRCKGCKLSEGGHYNRNVDGDYHSFEVAS